MDDKSLSKLEETLSLSKFAPKPKDDPDDESKRPSIDELLEAIHADYARMGENLRLLERRLRDSTGLMNLASQTLLDLIRTVHK